MMNWKRCLGCILSVSAVFGGGSPAFAYPTDEYERTGIRRLKWQYQIDFEGRRGRKMAPGSRWPGSYIQLRMLKEGRDFELTHETSKDPELQPALEKVVKNSGWRNYNIAILDITDPKNPRFAGINEHKPQTPGSVAKILVAAALLEQLAQRYPNDIQKREEMLRTHTVTADDWSYRDSHEIPVVWGDNLENVSIRRLRTGDTFTLWEWMDHALSPSNNSAASTTWREATLMSLLGENYPPANYDKELWTQWDRDSLSQASFETIDAPLLKAGIKTEDLKLRLYFTSGANRYIRSKSSAATPFAVVQWMLRVEQGRMVDAFSSLELKKMLYLTRRRVRYLFTRHLHGFGAFFKSGSLYRFSENAPRIQYQGDKINVLNTLVEIDTTPPPPDPTKEMAPPANAPPSPPGNETAEAPGENSGTAKPAPETDPLKNATKPEEPAAPPFVYIVSVMSNELKRNAAVDHARLAEAIHELITKKKFKASGIPARFLKNN